MCELLCEILNKCYRISRLTDVDVFFEYSPHVNTISVYMVRNGWTPETTSLDFEYLAQSLRVTKDNLKVTAAKLDDLECEMGVA